MNHNDSDPVLFAFAVGLLAVAVLFGLGSMLQFVTSGDVAHGTTAATCLVAVGVAAILAKLSR